MHHLTKLTHCPLVSVIIPVYNHENYVEQAVNSVFNQSYSNLEVIIIDDGSKDESAKQTEMCIEAWKKKSLNQEFKREIIFLKQANQGAHETINRGLSLAKGEFLTILNSDDFYHPHRIETFVNQMNVARAQFAFSYVIGIDEKDRRLPSYHWWSRWYENTKTRLFRSPSVGLILLQENLAVSTGNLFFSKDLYREVGPFKNLKLAHDFDFILRALTLAEPLVVRESLYFYRLHRTNTQYAVKHLMKEELQEIHRTYLTLVSAHPPKNLMAPCHWYWPLEFARVRLKLQMDKALNSYITSSHPERKESLRNKSTQYPTAVNHQQKDKSICLVSHDLSLTGAPKLVSDLALSLKRHGYHPSVVALCDGPMRLEFEKEGIPVNAPSGSALKRALYLIFYACFKTNSLTIVNSISSWPFVCLMALFRPFRTLKWYIHETSAPRSLDGRISHYLFKWFKYKKSRRMWFGSQSTREAWKERGIDGDTLYWSGIPSETRLKKSELPIKNILSVGTASARKGTHHLIEAFLNCLEKKLIPHDTILTIVGFPNSNSPDFAGLEDLILRIITSKFKENIRLIGAIAPEELDQYYQNGDLFIQSSIQECLPISLLTAMSKGMPIITTNVDGCVEAIQDKHNGYLCLPYNSQSISESIVEAINNPIISRQMGQCAQQTFNERFSLEVTQPIILKHLI